MKFLRQLFNRAEKPDEILVPEADMPDELRENDVQTETPAERIMDDDDTIVPAAPPSPDEEHEGEVTLAKDRPAVQRLGAQAVRVGHATHVGRVRKRNEDSALVITSTTLGDTILPPFGLFIVADGMGGHADGQRASQMAVRIVARDVMKEIFPPFLQIDKSEPSEPIQSILESSLQTANWEIQAGNPESGTTVTAALLLGERLFLAHVGDSRAYLIQDRETPAELITLDHSFVQRLQDTGQITAEEAAVHPQRNILYRAVGQGERLDVDTFTRPFPRPGWLVICSDGLWGEVDIALVQAAVTSATSPQQACNEMIEAALEAGGQDNISIVVVQFG